VTAKLCVLAIYREPAAAVGGLRGKKRRLNRVIAFTRNIAGIKVDDVNVRRRLRRVGARNRIPAHSG
jgi:hypothetical protein